MKKLYLLIALLMVLGVAVNVEAISIPQSESGADNAGPFVAYVAVQNASSSAMAVGDLACWSIDESTDDESNFVDDCDAIGTGIVAGVVLGSAIGIGETGLIAVHGVVDVNVQAGASCNTVNGPMCSSATAPYAEPCKDASVQTGRDIGFCVATGSTSNKVFLRNLW